jgi:hypothetical protein
VRRRRELRDALKLALFAARFQHTSASVSIRQKSSAYVSIRESLGDGVELGLFAERESRG